MTFEQALKCVDAHQSLIGTKTEQGFKIDDIIIVPSRAEHREAFVLSYMYYRDYRLAIIPYKSEDVNVWAIDTEHLFKANVLFYKELSDDDV